jgi:chemotaxis signal transduction protein
VVVLGSDRAEFGLAATEIHGVLRFRPDEVLPAPEVQAVAGCVRGVTGEALVLLDGGVLLEDSRFYVSDA